MAEHRKEDETFSNTKNACLSALQLAPMFNQE